MRISDWSSDVCSSDLLDLNPILVRADAGGFPAYDTIEGRNEVQETLDAQIIKDAKPVFELGEKMQFTYNIANTQRAIGTKLSSQLMRHYDMSGLQPDHLNVRLRGAAPQRPGALPAHGAKHRADGAANEHGRT